MSGIAIGIKHVTEVSSVGSELGALYQQDARRLGNVDRARDSRARDIRGRWARSRMPVNYLI